MSRIYSIGLRKRTAAGIPLRQALKGARMLILSSSQNAAAETGISSSSIIATLTANGSSVSSEVLPAWKATVTGTTGNINGLVLGTEVFAGTTDAAGSATMIKLTGGSASDHFYNGMFVIVTDHTGKGDIARITAYNGTSKEATVAALNGTTFTTQASTYGDFIVVNGIELLGDVVDNTGAETTTGTALVTQINSNMSMPEVVASAGATADIVMITGLNGTADTLNGYRLYAATTTGTTVSVTAATGQPAGGPFTVGVAGSGGMTWGPADDTTGRCEITSNFSTGTGVSYGSGGSSFKAGTMASFMIVVDPADDGTSTSTEYSRITGTIGTVSSNDLQVSSVARSQGDPMVITSYPVGLRSTTTT